MPGASHHQGNLNIDEYASRWVRGLVYLHLLSQTLILSFLLLTYLIVFLAVGFTSKPAMWTAQGMGSVPQGQGDGKH
jgi:hypothetical protein